MAEACESIRRADRGGTSPPTDPAELVAIARGQIASEDALARSAHRVLIVDTDALTTSLWSERLAGAVDPWLAAVADTRSYDLTLLTDVDVPWVADGVRYLPGEGRSFFARCAAELSRRGRRTVIVRGSWEERLSTAIAAVNELLPG